MTVVYICCLQLYKLNNNAENTRKKKTDTYCYCFMLGPILNWMQHWMRCDMVMMAIMMNIVVWDVTAQKTALMHSIRKLYVLTDFL